MTIDAATLGGIATVITALGVLINIVMTQMLHWRVNSQAANIQKIETATNSLVAKAEEAARREGYEQARSHGEIRAADLRASQAAAMPIAAAIIPARPDEPLPVADDRTAVASERVAEATERVAAATEKTRKP